MANTQYAFLMRSNAPNREALQASIDALGFDLKLDPEFTPYTDSGFSPCVLNGVGDVGFEIFYEDASSLEELEKIAGTNDFCIGMKWHGSLRDCASALIVGSALAKDFGAIISYEGNPPDTLEALLDEARQIIRDVANEPAGSLKEIAPFERRPWWKFW